VDVTIARPHPPAWSDTLDMPGNSMRENLETPAAPAVGSGGPEGERGE